MNATPAQIITGPNGATYARQVFELKGPKPSRIQVRPRGPLVAARDGRSFLLSDVAAVVRATELPLLVDWEHGSEYGNTKAAGWISRLTTEADGVYGDVTFTPQGAADVASQSYRYSSPSLLLAPDTKEARQIVGVALTNRPALTMQAVSGFSAALSARLPAQRAPLPFAPASSPALSQRIAMPTNFSEKYNTHVPYGMEVEAYNDCRRHGMTHEAIVRSFQYAQEKSSRAKLEGRGA